MTMQQFIYLKGTEEIVLQIPAPSTELVPGVCWGEPCVLFTPAYWFTQYSMRSLNVDPARHRIGETFAEEVTACLLGGYGIPAEVGNAAFMRLKQEGLIRTLCTDPAELEQRLYEPLQVQGRQIRYRFWKQKAEFLASVFGHLQSTDLPLDTPVELRNELMTLPGIGPKTASWIVRNWTSSDDVAILDIHVVRAGVLMKLFRLNERVETNYPEMEERFVDFAKQMTLPTSDLDSLIWSMMRKTPRLVTSLLRNLRTSITLRQVEPSQMPTA